MVYPPMGLSPTMMPRWLRSITTDDEWDTDLVLIAILISILFILGMTVYVVVFKGAQFDPMALGSGVATTLGGGGVGYWTKRLGDKKKNQGGTDDNALTSLFKD